MKSTINNLDTKNKNKNGNLFLFLFRIMQPAGRNYEIYDKELLAIVEALTKRRQYLLDATEKFEV